VTTRTSRRAGRSTLWFAGGVALSVCAWLAVVPWDLSELDEDGRVVRGGGDDNAPLIGVVAIVVSLVGVVLLGFRRTRIQAWLPVAGA
jgi:hypothetical protein